jgi:hypothetical protein
MVIQKRLLVLANSVKKGSGRCVAGREILPAGENKYRLGPWLRPVSDHGEGELWEDERLYVDGSPVSVLDFATVPLDEKVVDAGQPENWRIAGVERWRNISTRHKLPSRRTLEERPPDLWLQPNMQTDRVAHSYLTENPPKQSLYIVRPKGFRLNLRSETWDGRTKPKRRCQFVYEGVQYDLGLTDPVISERYDAQIPAAGHPTVQIQLPCADDHLICVSLAREFNGYHYKLVATVFEGIT